MKKILFTSFILAFYLGFSQPRTAQNIIDDFKSLGVVPTSVTDFTAEWDKDYIREVIGESDSLIVELLFNHDTQACRIANFSSPEAAQKWIESDYIKNGGINLGFPMVYRNGSLVLNFNWGSKDQYYEINQKMLDAFMK